LGAPPNLRAGTLGLGAAAFGTEGVGAAGGGEGFLAGAGAPPKRPAKGLDGAGEEAGLGLGAAAGVGAAAALGAV
jgi:hypothetical protein